MIKNNSLSLNIQTQTVVFYHVCYFRILSSTGRQVPIFSYFFLFFSAYSYFSYFLAISSYFSYFCSHFTFFVNFFFLSIFKQFII